MIVIEALKVNTETISQKLVVGTIVPNFLSQVWKCNMKLPVALLVLFLSFFADAGINSARLQNLNSASKTSDTRVIEGVGRHALSNYQSKEEGFKVAAELAKLDTSTKAGEYLEVVTLTDEEGKRKQFLATVSAATLSYKEVSRDMEFVSGELIATVKVSASYKVSDMKSSLSRFFQNAELKDALQNAKSKIDELNSVRKEQELMISSLIQANSEVGQLKGQNAKALEEKNLEVKRLKDQLYLKRTTVAQRIVEAEKSIMKLHSSKKFINSSVGIEQHNKVLAEIPAKEAEYLAGIEKLMDKVELGKSQFYSRFDSYTQNTIITLEPNWKLEKQYLNYITSIVSSRPYPNYRPKTSNVRNGPKVDFAHIFSLPWHIVRNKYAVYFVYEVNGKRYEVPFILPVFATQGKDYGDRRCYRGHPLGSGYRGEGNRILCIMYDTHPEMLRKEYLIASNYFADALPAEIKIPMGQDIEIETFFELRELKTNAVIGEFTR